MMLFIFRRRREGKPFYKESVVLFSKPFLKKVKKSFDLFSNYNVSKIPLLYFLKYLLKIRKIEKKNCCALNLEKNHLVGKHAVYTGLLINAI